MENNKDDYQSQPDEGEIEVKSKTDKDLSLSWRDTTGYLHRFTSGNIKPSNAVFTWAVLAVVAVFAGIIGCLLILYLPKPEIADQPKSLSQSTNLTLHPIRTFNIKMEPLACAAGRDLTFFVMSDSQIIHFDGDGKKIRTWKIEFPEKSAGGALCYVYSEPKGKGGTGFSALYIATGNKVYILNPELAEEPVHFLTLDAGAFVNSMRISDTFLFMVDASKKLVYRYDLTSGEQGKLVLGAPDEQTHFPGFGPSTGTTLDLALFSKEDILLVTNPLLFRLEAFDIKTGQWRSEFSWGRHPGQENGFCGTMNPIHIDSFGSEKIVTVEYGVPSKIKIFSKQGAFLCSFIPFEKMKIPNAPGFPKVLVLQNSTVAAVSQNGNIEFFE